MSQNDRKMKSARLYEVFRWGNTRPGEDDYPETIYLVRAANPSQAVDHILRNYREPGDPNQVIRIDGVYEIGVCFPPVWRSSEFIWDDWINVTLRGPYFQSAINEGYASWRVEEGGLVRYEGNCPSCDLALWEQMPTPQCPGCGWDRADPEWSPLQLPS